MSSIKIAALVTDAYGGRGGIAQYNRDFFRAIASDDSFASTFILPRHGPVQVPVRLPDRIEQVRPQAGRLPYALTTLRYLLARRIDVIFCGHLFMAPLAAAIAKLKGAKLIIQAHGIEAWSCPSWLHRIAIESADVVLAVSRYTRAAVLSWAAISPERVLVVNNTVGDKFFPGDGSAVRANLGLDGKFVLLTVGRLDSRERYKGHDRIITAMATSILGAGDIVYLIIGEGDDRPRLEALTKQSGVDSRVYFMGPVSQSVLLDAYRAADLFVMPSSGEGFGISFIEAMACGTPAVGLAQAGTQDALADGELGTLVTEKEQFAETINHLLSKRRKVEADILSKAVRARFGRKEFERQILQAMKRAFEGESNTDVSYQQLP